MDFVRRPVIVAYVPADNRTMYLIGENWKEVSRALPDHNTMDGLLVANVPVIELHKWNSSVILRAALGLLDANTVAAKFEDGSRLWLSKRSIDILLRSPDKPSAGELEQLFPYLKDAEIQRLQNYDFEQHKKPLITFYEN